MITMNSGFVDHGKAKQFLEALQFEPTLNQN